MRETSIFKTDLGPSLDLITLATIFFVGINSLQLGAQQLPDSAISIDSLTVTVLRGSDAINQTPYAISIRDQVDLQLGNTGLSLEAALQGLPGVQVENRYNYAVGERISIRGFGNVYPASKNLLPAPAMGITIFNLSSSQDILFLVSGKKKLNIFRKWKEGRDLPANSISAKNQILVMSFDVS